MTFITMAGSIPKFSDVEYPRSLANIADEDTALRYTVSNCCLYRFHFAWRASYLEEITVTEVRKCPVLQIWYNLRLEALVD
jgi:hypothetical protein